MKLFLKSIIKKYFLRGPLTALLITAFVNVIVFDVVWCASTTFRAMSDVALYFNSIVAAFLLVLPYAIFRRLWVEVVVMIIADLIMICNLMYCRTYLGPIPIESYALAGNLADFKASVVDSLRWIDILIPLTTLVGMIVAARRKPRTPGGVFVPYLLLTIAVSIPSVAIAAIRGGMIKHISALKESCYYSTTPTPIYTLAGPIIYELMQQSDVISEADSELVADWLSRHDSLVGDFACADSIASDMLAEPSKTNLIVIACESFESWLINRTVDGIELTPYLNSLISDSTTMFVPMLLTQVGTGRSIDFQLMLNSGLLPMQNSVYSMRYPDSTYPSLPKAMKQANMGADFKSYILSCDKPVTWNQAIIAKSFGIDTLLSASSWRTDELVGNPPKLSDGSFMRQIVEKMKSGDIYPVGQKALIEIITYSGHNPFRLPEELKTISFAEDYPERMRDYMMMAHYTDSSLRPLIDYLKTRPDYANTVIVITGDHEGLAADRVAILKNNPDANIVDFEQFTPMIILNAPANMVRNFKTPDVAGQIDMYPTLLTIMGLGNYEWHGLGQNIMSDLRTPVAISKMTQRVVGNQSAVPDAQMKHLRDAFVVSDRIIKYDLFKQELPEE